MKNKNKSEEIKVEPVSDEWLQYWIDNQPGGSGLNISLQWKLKSVSIELLHLRKEVERLTNK